VTKSNSTCKDCSNYSTEFCFGWHCVCEGH